MSEPKERGFVLDAGGGYFHYRGADVMAFDDIYPEGHQAGVSLILHGKRAATNGDLRFEPTPGQWQPVPKQIERIADPASDTVRVRLEYPDRGRHLRGFNPMIYPDFEFGYEVTVRGEGESVTVSVDLDRPVPEEFLGKLRFNLELFPGELFGKPWIMDKKSGIFPRQPNGPVREEKTNLAHTLPPVEHDGPKTDPVSLSGGGKGYSPIAADDLIAEPYAAGRRFTCRPDDPLRRFTVESEGADLELFDGRMNHNNGWFVLSSAIPGGKTAGALFWRITPDTSADWISAPVIQLSQVGYHPAEPKTAVVELDSRDGSEENARLYRITERGEALVKELAGKDWGRFLRYRYRIFDFTDVSAEGLYRVRYGGSESSVFRIARDVYDRGVWQPVLEYFLPVQMCHMRVNEKYRVWHDRCHTDDAKMAPLNCNHIDGYAQGPSTLTKYAPGEHVPGLDAGGWHDAGDYDLRVESQAGEAYILALTYEAFGVDWDATTVDQKTKTVEIHQPDGKNDILQQVEHGMLSVAGGYKSLGRLYRGIICADLRQYVLLGDAASMTDGIPGNEDDRWVFTEDNPPRELTTAAQMAACARVLRDFNPDLAADCLDAARELWRITPWEGRAEGAKIHAAAELLLTTGEEEYRDFLLTEREFVTKNIRSLGWIVCRVLDALRDDGFAAAVREALIPEADRYAEESAETPYGIPYRPHIWGAGWDIQSLGFRYYFLCRAFPEIFPKDLVFNALHFVLGCHPGSNTASFASGVGAKSATVAYGANRADWSFIPGGVVSGTALIRPDFPELLEFPFLWQQMEYVMGGGSSHYMFLVLAARRLLGE
ncbi:MAG: glycoside hydrolase family 9 protein [Clostridia bacterium]|nr:glycoside hydrolase family 9 protein [Clostridia bacterium]